MGCFSVQKNRRKCNEQQQRQKNPDLEAFDECKHENSAPSRQGRMRATQHPQRLMNRNPRLRSSYPSYETKAQGDNHGASLAIPMAIPMPLPLPTPCHPNPVCYRLPPPSEHAVNSAFSAPIASPLRLRSSASTLIVNNTSSLVKGLTLPLSAFHTTELQPLPPPLDQAVSGLRSFSYKQLAASCQNFSLERCLRDGVAYPSYAGVLNRKAEKGMEVAIDTLCAKGELKEWLAELCSLTRLHGPRLCKIIGFYTGKESVHRFLVYERLAKGSLDKLLYGGSESPPLDWPSRINIALDAAEGLAHIHDKSPEKIIYRDLRTSNIDVDVDFSSKLSGYGFVNFRKAGNDDPVDEAYCAPETTDEGHISVKSNVWSFGIILLELLTGRQNMDSLAPARDERNLAKWTRLLNLTNAGCELFSVMDPKLQREFPIEGANMVANLAFRCLQQDPIRRPTMREATDVLKAMTMTMS